MNRKSQRKRVYVDHWTKPSNATEEELHLMVEQMESMFLADKEFLKTFYGGDFKEKRLPRQQNLKIYLDHK
jgi:hypothetical protein